MIAPTITPLYLRTQLENLIDDAYDTDFEYQLLTQSKNDIENKLKLAILQDIDQTQTANVGDSYLTLKSLPATCRTVNKIDVGIIQYFPARYDQLVTFRNSPRKYYIDYKKMVQGLPCLGLTGKVGSSQPITIFFQAGTQALTQANETTAGVVLWPDEFQPLIPYHVGRILQGNVDADEINFRMSAEQEAEYQNLMDGFIAWNADLKLAEMNFQGGYADEYTEIPFDVGYL